MPLAYGYSPSSYGRYRVYRVKQTVLSANPEISGLPKVEGFFFTSAS